MIWKELHVARTGGLTKVALVILGFAMVGLIIYSGFDMIVAAFDEMIRDGYFETHSARRSLNEFLRFVCVALLVLWSLGVAASAATNLTSEREEDQWISLVSTPLEGWEILRAKMLAPVWGLRLVAGLLALLMGLGLVTGAIHPFGVIAGVIEFVVMSWFLTALGTTFSLYLKNSTRALAATMALLIFLNGGYLFCCIPFRPNTQAIGSGSTPFVFAVSLMSIPDFNNLGHGHQSADVVAACVLCVLFYGLAAAGLTFSLFHSFDSAVDRPDRFRQTRTTRQQAEFYKGKIKTIQYLDEDP